MSGQMNRLSVFAANLPTEKMSAHDGLGYTYAFKNALNAHGGRFDGAFVSSGERNYDPNPTASKWLAAAYASLTRKDYPTSIASAYQAAKMASADAATLQTISGDYQHATAGRGQLGPWAANDAYSRAYYAVVGSRTRSSGVAGSKAGCGDCGGPVKDVTDTSAGNDRYGVAANQGDKYDPEDYRTGTGAIVQPLNAPRQAQDRAEVEFGIELVTGQKPRRTAPLAPFFPYGRPDYEGDPPAELEAIGLRGAPAGVGESPAGAMAYDLAALSTFTAGVSAGQTPNPTQLTAAQQTVDSLEIQLEAMGASKRKTLSYGKLGLAAAGILAAGVVLGKVVKL